MADAVAQLRDFSPDVCGITCDVADPASVVGAARASFERLGNVHVLCNNAGVAAAGGIDEISLENWRWVLDGAARTKNIRLRAVDHLSEQRHRPPADCLLAIAIPPASKCHARAIEERFASESSKASPPTCESAPNATSMRIGSAFLIASHS